MFLNVITVFSGLIDAVLASGLLCFRWLSPGDRGRRRWPIQSMDLMLAVLAAAASLSVKCVLLVLSGDGLFGVIRLTYFDCVVALPVVGATLLIHRSIRPRGATGPGTTPSVTLFAVLAMLAAPVGFHATYIEPFDLRVERPTVAVEAIPAGSRPIVVGILADIQTERVGAHEHRAIDAVMAGHPDLIVIPGDIYQGPDAEFAARVGDFRLLLGKLSAPGGVYVVTGDVDTRYEIAELISGTAVRWLDDEVVDLMCRGVPIRLAGVNLRYESRAARAVYRHLADGPKEAVRILFAHRPAAIAECLAEGTRPDVTLAGHTHGGQVCIPGFGPIITFSALPRKHASGLSRYNGAPLYVSRGVGCEDAGAPRMRLFCPPEVTLISLVSKHAGDTHDRSIAFAPMAGVR